MAAGFQAIVFVTRRKELIGISLLGLLFFQLQGPRTLMAGEILTLEQGIEIAMDNNPGLKAAGSSVKVANQGVREARGRFFPRIDVSESFVRTNGPGEVFWTQLSQERFSLSEFAAANPNDPDPITNYMTRVTLSQPLYAGGRIHSGYQISKLQRDAAVHSREHTRQAIVREFTAAYYGALLAERFIAVAEQARTAVEAHTKMAADLLAEGMALRSDYLQARVHLSEVEARWITARNQRRLALANLNRIMGRDQGREVQLVEQERPETDGPENLEQLIEAARKDHPALRRMALMAETAEKGIEVARAGFLPDLNFVAQYNRNDQDFIGDDGEYWTVMAVANINLFEGFGAKARVARATAEKEMLNNQVSQSAQGIELEVRRAYHNLEEAGARLAVARRAVGEAEETMAIIEDRYGAGMARITELLDTESALTQARTNAARAKYDLSIAGADLDLAVGRL